MNNCEECNPKCERCQAPITTGMMAALCPLRERCEFWPEDQAGQEFVRAMRGEVSNEVTP